MSTLQATCADNKWMPDGQTALGGKKKTCQPTKVRFELPFHAQCAHCGAHLKQGTRSNAVKGVEEEGWTWTFRTRSKCCQGEAIVRADVRKGTYEAVSGLVAKHEEAELVVEAHSDVEDGRTKRSAMRELEQKTEARKVEANMSRMDERRDAEKAKAKLRMARRKRDRCEREAAQLGLAEHVKLLPKESEDEWEANHAMSKVECARRDRDHVRNAKRDVRKTSIFGKTTAKDVLRTGKRRAY